MFSCLLAIIINGVEYLKPDSSHTYEQIYVNANEILTAEYLNGPDIDILSNPKVEQLVADFRYTHLKPEERASLDALMISKFGLIELPTSPKTPITEKWLEERAGWVRMNRMFASSYKGDEENFWRLCDLIATIKEIDYPTYMVRLHKFIPNERQLGEYALQEKARDLNLAIRSYRSALAHNCYTYINRVCMDMSDEELEDFSKRVLERTRIPSPTSEALFHEVKFQRRIKKERDLQRRNSK